MDAFLAFMHDLYPSTKVADLVWGLAFFGFLGLEFLVEPYIVRKAEGTVLYDHGVRSWRSYLLRYVQIVVLFVLVSTTYGVGATIGYGATVFVAMSFGILILVDILINLKSSRENEDIIILVMAFPKPRKVRSVDMMGLSKLQDQEGAPGNREEGIAQLESIVENGYTTITDSLTELLEEEDSLPYRKACLGQRMGFTIDKNGRLLGNTYKTSSDR